MFTLQTAILHLYFSKKFTSFSIRENVKVFQQTKMQITFSISALCCKRFKKVAKFLMDLA